MDNGTVEASADDEEPDDPNKDAADIVDVTVDVVTEADDEDAVDDDDGGVDIDTADEFVEGAADNIGAVGSNDGLRNDAVEVPTIVLDDANGVFLRLLRFRRVFLPAPGTSTHIT